MKHSGKPGKHKSPVGYRTSSTFLHRKVSEVKRLKSLEQRKKRK